MTEIKDIYFSYTEIKAGDSISEAASKFMSDEPEKYDITKVSVRDYGWDNTLLNDGSFEDGKTYKVVVEAAPKNGYRFMLEFDTETISDIYVDGYLFSHNLGISEEKVYFEYIVTVGKKEIKEINLIFNEPVIGKTPEFFVSTYTTVPAGAITGDFQLVWYVGSDFNMSDRVKLTENDVFEADKFYEAQISGYYNGINEEYYEDNACFKVNGVERTDMPFMYTPEDVHNLVKISAKAVSCTVDGNKEYYKCSICGKYYADDNAKNEMNEETVVIKATGHKWDAGKVTKEATTKETGVKTYTCTVCGETKTEEIEKLEEPPKSEAPVSVSIGTLTAKGIYCAQDNPSIIAAFQTESSKSSDTIEYRWLACEENEPTVWFEVSPWTKDNYYLSWTPVRTGNYIIVAQARIVGNEDSTLVKDSFGVNFKKPGIKQICQMPYWGEGGGYLIGFESYDNPNQEYQYEMFVMDLSLYSAGSPTPWVHATGKIKLPKGATPEEGKTMWTVWQPQYGYYLTLFRLYDKDGNMIDEVPYGFANAY